MRAQLIHSSDYRVMPWKNGGGQTTELAIEPRTATLEEGFQWRVSMADVGTDGPFSPFPDYERTLMLLQGKGLDLDFNGHGRKRLETLLDPIQFSGDWSAKSALLDGPCRDFNVITRKGLKHRIAVLRPEPRAVLPEAPTRLLYGVRGKASVSP
ncbi:MAG: HutD family protein, partial [Firmicutes bacterium]|nr:HutD family protein [Bacillota bacterium]